MSTPKSINVLSRKFGRVFFAATVTALAVVWSVAAVSGARADGPSAPARAAADESNKPSASGRLGVGSQVTGTYRGLSGGTVTGSVVDVDAGLLFVKLENGASIGHEPDSVSSLDLKGPQRAGGITFKQWKVAAGDQVSLKVKATDDRQLTGTVLSTSDRVVKLKLRDGSTVVLDRSRLRVADSHSKDASKSKVLAPPRNSKAGEAVPASDAADETVANVDAVRRKIFILPLKETVGIQLRAKEMEAVRQLANEEKARTGVAQIVVLHLDSPGGLVLETEAIEKALMGIREDGHRLVAWIRYATSGGAFTAMYAPEIYFETGGTMGSITMITNGPDGPKHVAQDAEAWEAKLDECMEKTNVKGRPGMIGRAMAHRAALLSYDRDPETGEVTFYDTLEGKYVLSNAEQNLNFNAPEAAHCGFSGGTADSREKLLELMSVNPATVEWSNAGEKLHEKWMKTCARCTDECFEISREMRNGGQAQGTAEAVLRARIKGLDKLIEWWKKAPEMMRYELRAPEVEDLERQRADLQEQLRRALRQGN